MPEHDHQPTSRRRVVARRVAVVAGVALVVPLLAVLGLGGYLWASTDVPPPGAVQNPQASVLRYADGSELARLSEENRTSVPLEQVSLQARDAVLAAEDRGFYDDGGISPTGILRAAWTNLRSGEVEQGGSTITQQYARNAFLTQERTWSRKVRELVMAVKLDRSRTKDEVLERYLNTVYFGRGAYGIEAAAQTFFGTSAAELTASQGAVLASMLRSPSAYDPADDPERARERWRYTLEGMAEQGWLDGPVEAQQYPDVLPDQPDSVFGGPEGYLVQQVLDELEALGHSEDDVLVGGYVVDTTFDRRAQAAAVRALEEVTGPRLPEDVYRALVSVQPGTGRVVASYGGRDYLERSFDAATQGSAQAGSSFKPFVLAAALKDGISLRSRFDGSSPQEFGDYEVRNYGGQDFGRIDLVTATRNSVNTVYVPLGLEAGLDDVAETAASLGVRADMSPDRAGASLSLGVTAVTPLDMANAYATLAAGGVRAQPFVVERVTDRYGQVLHEAEPDTGRVLAEDVAADVSYALQQVVARGTGTAARLDDRPAAGKTGTTTENTAAWFVGYTPRLATAVTLYTERTDMSLRDIAGVREVTGGSLPARAWGSYTEAVVGDQEPLDFPEPAFVGSRLSPSPSPQTSSPRPPRRPAPTQPEPTPEATEEPTQEPTQDPTEVPTRPDDPLPTLPDPEPEPTDEPDPEPTDEPDPEPSAQPEPTGGTDARTDTSTSTSSPDPTSDVASTPKGASG